MKRKYFNLAPFFSCTVNFEVIARVQTSRDFRGHDKIRQQLFRLPSLRRAFLRLVFLLFPFSRANLNRRQNLSRAFAFVTLYIYITIVAVCQLVSNDSTFVRLPPSILRIFHTLQCPRSPSTQRWRRSRVRFSRTTRACSGFGTPTIVSTSG